MTAKCSNTLISIVAVIAGVGLFWLPPAMLGQTTSQVQITPATSPKTVFTGPRALYEWIAEFTAAYGLPVTYEEPLWPGSVTSGRLYPNLSPGAELGNVQKLIDDHFDASKALQSSAQGAKAVLEASLSLYKAQGNKGSFRLFEKNGLLHVTPDQIAGNLTIAPLLDTPIAVSTSERLPLDAVKAIAEQIQRIRGLTVNVDIGAFGFRFNEAYSGGTPAKINWGTQQMSARDALTSLLSGSMTTTTWLVFCQPLEKGAVQCNISLTPLIINVEGADGKRVNTRFISTVADHPVFHLRLVLSRKTPRWHTERVFASQDSILAAF